MSAEPRHDIREHVSAIIEIASRADPLGVDAALHDVPAAWDLSSITQERHGYGYHAILDCGSVGGAPAYGYGPDIATAIRQASEAIRQRGQADAARDDPGDVLQFSFGKVGHGD